MKLWPDLFRARAADNLQTRPRGPVGASGTVNLHGFLVPDEYNQDLAWPQSLPVYKRMLRSDSAVREAYMHTAAPILNATWDIDPASDDPLDLEVAEMVRRAYFEWMETPFEPTMALTLKYLAQGFQLFEVTEKVIDAELVYADPKTGDEVTVPRRQFVTWKRWEHRRPETVYRWHAPEGVLEQIDQQALKDDVWGTWEIPAETCALFVHEQEGDDFSGVSLLRSAYKAWWMKELVEKVMAMAVERHGLGINTAYLPEDARNDASLANQVEEMLQHLKAGESNYLVFPGPKQLSASSGQATSNGYLFEINTPQGGLPDFKSILEYLRGEIKGNVLARFSELGHGSTGARATANTQAEIWYAALHATADYVASVHNEKIKQLVVKNYNGIEQFPKLVPRDIETKSLIDFAQANAQLVAAGAIVADDSYRGFIRQGLDAPDEDEVEETDPALTEPETDPAAIPPAPKTDPALQKSVDLVAAAVERLEEAVAAIESGEPVSATSITVGGPQLVAGEQLELQIGETFGDVVTAALEPVLSTFREAIAAMAPKPTRVEVIRDAKTGRVTGSVTVPFEDE